MGIKKIEHDRIERTKEKDRKEEAAIKKAEEGKKVVLEKKPVKVLDNKGNVVKIIKTD